MEKAWLSRALTARVLTLVSSLVLSLLRNLTTRSNGTEKLLGGNRCYHLHGLWG